MFEYVPKRKGGVIISLAAKKNYEYNFQCGQNFVYSDLDNFPRKEERKR